MTRQLQHEDANERIDAILRFGVLWRFRWQVWPRLEDGAHMHIKVKQFCHGIYLNIFKVRTVRDFFGDFESFPNPIC